MEKNLTKKFYNLNIYEQDLKKEGYELIAGVDEVGRGPVAGPLVVALVILDEEPILGLDDSKKLTKKKIKLLNEEIIAKAKYYEILEYSVEEVDERGIRVCVLDAMTKLVNNSPCDAALIDYEKIETDKHTISLKKGDSVSNSIAAASIIAKYYRDNIMCEVAIKHPEYSFETNVGYLTAKHKNAIANYGIIKGVHRCSYEPIKSIVESEK